MRYLPLKTTILASGASWRIDLMCWTTKSTLLLQDAATVNSSMAATSSLLRVSATASMRPCERPAPSNDDVEPPLRRARTFAGAALSSLRLFLSSSEILEKLPRCSNDLQRGHVRCRAVHSTEGTAQSAGTGLPETFLTNL